MDRARRIVTLILVAVAVSIPGRVRAQDEAPRLRLRQVTNALVPYRPDGDSLDALVELAELGRSVDPRVAATARFLRAAASVDLFVYSDLTDDPRLRESLAAALGVELADLVSHIDQELRDAALGAFAPEVESCRTVLACAADPAREGCTTRIRRVADSGRAGATAARLMIFEAMVRTAEESRAGPAARATALLVEQGSQLCASPQLPAVARPCQAAANERDQPRRQAALVRAVIAQAAQDLRTLRQFAEGGDPMARLASGWLDGAVERMGWSLLPQPFTTTSFADLTLPGSDNPSTLPPLELLVVSRSGVSVALTPATVVTVDGPLQLDEEAGFPLPGRRVLALPAEFRPVVLPVSEVTEALGELRQSVTRVLEPLGDNGPTWLPPQQATLGVLVDRGVLLVDLARFVVSAQRAGYERFILMGLRDDGQLGVIPADFGTVRDGPEPRNLPRLRVSPLDVSFTPNAGIPVEASHDEFPGLAPPLAGELAGGRHSFAAQGRIALTYGRVFPAIDAIMAAAPSGTPPVHFLLPP